MSKEKPKEIPRRKITRIIALLRTSANAHSKRSVQKGTLAIKHQSTGASKSLNYAINLLKEAIGDYE